MNKILILSAISATFFSCTSISKVLGDKDFVVFDKQLINFNPQENRTNLQDEIVKIDNGRIILKKLKLPAYSKFTRVTVEAEIISAGDPWDKTGSFFLIPASSKINFLTDNSSFKQLFKDSTDTDFFPGVVPVNGYEPAVEILRFMTPFGVGHFSNDPKLMMRKPVYIPKWEEKVTWTQDVTQLISELGGEVWVGAFVDVWTKEGYKFSAKLKFEETKAKVYPKEETKVIPLVNTARYTDPQRLYDKFSRRSLTYQFAIPAGYRSAKLYYITTGHGGHNGGDEFVKKENIVTLNGEILYKEIPWRDDCASFRRFNPHSGVWTEKRTARVGNLKSGDTKEMEIDEFIASSDYSRSNWCPGSKVDPIILDIKNMKVGSNTITISIPEAQPEDGDKMNHWNVSAYLVLTK